MFKRIIYLSLGAIILVSSCKKKEEVPVFDPSLDFENAKALFSVFNGTYVSLYKITDDNIIEEMNLVNSDGITQYELPYDDVYFSIYNPLNGSNFLLSNYAANSWDKNGNPVFNTGLGMIDKSSGKIVTFSGFDNTYPEIFNNSFLNDFNVQSGKTNVFFSDGSYVYKIDQSFSIEKYSPEGKSIYHYKVNSDEYMMYFDEKGELFLKNPSGSIVSISDNVLGSIESFWLGYDNNFYIYRSDFDTFISYIDKITIDGLQVSVSNIISDVSNDFNLSNFGYFKELFLDASLFIPTNAYQKSWIFYEKTGELKDVTLDLPDFGDVSDVDASFGYFYVNTGDNIYKIDLNLQSTGLFDQGKFEIYSMCVDNNNNVLFNALRNADGKVVFGTIDSSGTMSIINETLNKKVEYLEFM